MNSFERVMYGPKKILLLMFGLLLFSAAFAQEQPLKVQEGVLLKKGTTIRIGNADIYNRRKNLRSTSNDFGVFRILASSGDTLKISGMGYIQQKMIVKDFRDTTLFLQGNNELQEVYVREKTLRQDLQEMRKEYTRKGSFYHGRPPLLTAIFKPVTFLNELFGRNARNARRFDAFAQKELGYHEVASRFNNYTIKNAIPIKDSELEDFKEQYWPNIDQVKRWNDYDLMAYIKRSYADFLKKKPGTSGLAAKDTVSGK